MRRSVTTRWRPEINNTFFMELADSGLYLDDPSLGVDKEHFRCVCGISLDFPARQTVSHSQAADIARHFFNSGELPTTMKWSEG
jgi:hypothetical protein